MLIIFDDCIQSRFLFDDLSLIGIEYEIIICTGWNSHQDAGHHCGACQLRGIQQETDQGDQGNGQIELDLYFFFFIQLI